MYYKDPNVVSRQQEMTNLLVNQGMSIAEVATQVGLSKKRVYSFAASRKLPYNRPVKVGGRKESQILRMIALGYQVDEVAETFGMAVTALQNVLRSAHATQVRSDSRHSGEVTPLATETDGDAR